jgi:hypothetical protein
MNIRIGRLVPVILAFALLFTTSCATTSGASKSKQSLLLEAGFKAMPASSQVQQAVLGKLKPDKFSTVQRNGKTMYVFPDPANNTLYAGYISNYQRYKQLVQASNLAYTEQQLDDATGYFGNKSSNWKNWSTDGGQFQQ